MVYIDGITAIGNDTSCVVHAQCVVSSDPNDVWNWDTRPKVKFVKVHEDAILPKFNIVDDLKGDIGADVYSVEDFVVPAHGAVTVAVGIKVGYIEPGYYFVIAPRSGLGFKYGVQPHCGRIDPSYLGDLGIRLYNLSGVDYPGKKGDRIAQLEFHQLIQPKLSWIAVEDVVPTSRGEGGFGSTGN